MERAFTSACRGCGAFYRHDPAPTKQGAARGTLGSWPERAFPIRVAFEREYSGDPIQARDSVAFWQAADELEARYGADLFRPARAAETTPDDFNGPTDVVLVYTDPSLRFAGLTTLFWHGADVTYAAIRLRRPPVYWDAHQPSVMRHELMHALGFGHTCAWRSVLAETERCPVMRAETATPEDVAYAQVIRRVRALQREHGARWGIEAALAGERALVRGDPPGEPPLLASTPR